MINCKTLNFSHFLVEKNHKQPVEFPQDKQLSNKHAWETNSYQTWKTTILREKLMEAFQEVL